MMIDQTTQKPFRIKSDEIAGPFLSLPLAQLVASARYSTATRSATGSIPRRSRGWQAGEDRHQFRQTGDAARIQATLDEAG